VIIVCRPKGRGNWAPTIFAIEGGHISAWVVRVGDTFVLGDVTFRIVRIEQ
jgi:hypothetical protein